MIFIGIDPGLTGALASIDSKTNEIRIFDTPVAEVVVNKKRKHVQNLMAIVLLLQELSKGPEQVLVIIEKVNAMPGGGERSMGATSAFNFGLGFGQWLGIIAALLLSSEQVHPMTWKKVMMAGMDKEKDASRLRAMQMFPQIASQLQRKKDHGRAEALLLAAYGMKQQGQQLPVGAGMLPLVEAEPF